jgi:hypothetical protein
MVFRFSNLKVFLYYCSSKRSISLCYNSIYVEKSLVFRTKFISYNWTKVFNSFFFKIYWYSFRIYRLTKMVLVFFNKFFLKIFFYLLHNTPIMQSWSLTENLSYLFLKFFIISCTTIFHRVLSFSWSFLFLSKNLMIFKWLSMWSMNLSYIIFDANSKFPYSFATNILFIFAFIKQFIFVFAIQNISIAVSKNWLFIIMWRSLFLLHILFLIYWSYRNLSFIKLRNFN